MDSSKTFRISPTCAGRLTVTFQKMAPALDRDEKVEPHEWCKDECQTAMSAEPFILGFCCGILALAGLLSVLNILV